MLIFIPANSWIILGWGKYTNTFGFNMSEREIRNQIIHVYFVTFEHNIVIMLQRLKIYPELRQVQGFS